MADKHTDVSAVEKIKEASRGLRGSLAPELAADTSHFEDAAAQLLKFHGVYQQDDRDTRRQRSDAGLEPDYSFMVRCKIPGGVLTADQYLALDELAGRFGNGTLRVTTRQDNQFHGVVKGDLKATIRALNDVLVTTLGACGDVVRNVVTCPAPLPGGLRSEVLQLARRLSDHLLPRTRAYHEIWLNGEQVAEGAPQPEPIYGSRYLPRKFKVAIALPDDNCCDVHSNDLGFLVVSDGGRLAGFNVLVGGGLGRTHGKQDTYPRLADTLGFAATDEAIEVAEAVVKVQRDHGDRGDRRHARLKYLLDERGLDWFRDEVERQLGRPLAPAAPVQVSDIEDHLGWHEQGRGRSFLGVFVENGRIRDGEDRRLRSALRRVVETVGGGVRFSPTEPAVDRHPRPAEAARGPDPGRPRHRRSPIALGRAALVHGVPRAPDLRARGRRGGEGAAGRDRGARGRARATGCCGCGAHGPDDRVPQRLRATLHRRPRVRRSFAAQVRPVRRRQYARHEAGDVVCRSGSTRSAHCHRPPAVRALPRR